MRANNGASFVDTLTEIKADFLLTCSNYSMKIVTENINLHFVTKEQSKRTFAAFAKIKSGLKDKTPPDVTRDDLIYFVHDFRKDMSGESVMNIDLKSAYAHCLFIDGFIPRKTYSYIKKLNKPERLAAVGMLASRKENFRFSKGKPDFEGETVSPYAPYFFHAVRRTFDIMSELKRIIGRDYLFTWVDGIYFRPNGRALADCDDFLRSLKFPYSTEYLNNFSVRIYERKVFVSFFKEQEYKTFNIPLTPSPITQAMHRAILASGNAVKPSTNFSNIKKNKNETD